MVESLSAPLRLRKTTELSFERDGAQRFRAAVYSSTLHEIGDAVAELPPEKAGIRL